MSQFIELGGDATLRIRIPRKLTTDWADLIREECFLKIVNHDHSGVNGLGKPLGAGSLGVGTVKGETILLFNNEWVQGKNALGVNTNLYRFNANDNLEVAVDIEGPTLIAPVITPVSSDPLSPVEGQLQVSDGTHRPAGIYTYVNGSWLASPITASNQGTGEGLFIQKNGNDLEFRSLKAGPFITLNQTSEEIEIAAVNGGGGAGGFTEVNTQDYVIQANDNNLAIDANFNIRLIMPDPALFPGRTLRFFVENLGLSNNITLRDHTDSIDLFSFRSQDVQPRRFPGGGSNQRSMPFIEFTAYNFSTNGSVFWGISDFSDKIKSNKLALTLQTVNGSYNLNSPLVLFQQNLGSTELFQSINVSTSFKYEFSGSNSDFVFRFDTRIGGVGGWTAGKAYVLNFDSAKEGIIYLDETINATGTGVNELLEVRLGCYRLNGLSSLTIGDSAVGALVLEVVVRKEL